MFSVMMLGANDLLQPLIESGINIHHFNITRKNYEFSILCAGMEEHPNILFIPKPAMPTAQHLHHLKTISPETKFVFWSGDVRKRLLKPLRLNKDILDLFLTNHNGQRGLFKKGGIKKVETFHSALSPRQISNDNIEIVYDIFFGGNNFNNKFPLGPLRKKLIYNVNKHFNLIVHGRGWNNNKLVNNCGIVRKLAYSKAIQQAKMCIGINHFHLPRYYGYRTWHSLASGRLHLIYYIPGMEKDFENGKHLVWFKSIKEALKLIKYYLNNEKECEEIGANGRKLILEQHTWENRAPLLKTIFEQLL